MTCSKSSRSGKSPRRNSVLRVALTGGIACGKSVVSRILAEKGCVVLSSDATAHALMLPGRPAWKAVVARFGRGILRADRTIDRARLGPIVFADPAARRFLDRLVHPLVLAKHEKAARRLERAGGGPPRIFVVEAALTIEAGYARHFDRVVVVHCGKAEQVRRLRLRDGLSGREALRRIGTQMSRREKLAHADYAIDTSGPLAGTVEEAERLYAQLVRDAELKI
ncbi:MAG: dephospho-CoA kinase [Candidatus Aminicenantes bacterium RBG_16_66_30]|nr:MAG: dephospho-CoA kinase [Candidatus Aminicenantes bacterium RBG_16_66_30]